MQFAKFLSGAPEAPTRPISFRALGRNADGQKVSATVRAVLAFVDESERAEARREARKHLVKDLDGAPIPADDLHLEVTYQMLFRALRDADDPSRRLFASDLELRRALTMATCGQLAVAYAKFVDEEFPDNVTKDEYDQLVDGAAGESNGDRL